MSGREKVLMEVEGGCWRGSTDEVTQQPQNVGKAESRGRKI